MVFHWYAGVIGILNIDGSGEKVIFKADEVLDPSWSPDGKRIAFVSWFGDKEKSGIYLMNSDGSGVLSLTLDEQPQSPVWSPDGQKLLFQSGTQKESVIYQIDIDGQNKKLLTNGIDPTWQPLIEDGPDDTTTS